MNILLFSTLYPNAATPNHGIFVENRLRHLTQAGVTATVIAPLPWFPGRFRHLAAVPATETRFGLTIHHPRYLALPGLGMALSPTLLARAAAPTLARLLTGSTPPKLIDAHYVFPDGVAAVALGRRFALPVVITARGSDITQFPAYFIPRRLILAAARRAAALIAVSDGLHRAMAALGIPPDRVTVLRNGIDTTLFRPAAREASRAALGLTGPTLVSVGALIPRKGHDLTIQALTHLPAWTLLIAGEGPERDPLTRLAAKLGVANRVRLLGPLPHADLPALYTAADISVLSSSREGWANVLLESLACGTPVVASPIPGNDEVITAPQAGRIAAARTPEAIADAIQALAAAPPSREATAAYASAFSWDATTAGQIEVFRKALG